MAEANQASGIASILKKRWRGWLRAVHRDFGYLAVGFTLIYAVSGIAINHISDWDPNFTSIEKTLTITPIHVDLPDDAAVALVTAAAGTGKPDDVFRAGDEIRLTYSSGAQVTVIGDTLTVQARKPRFFLRVANWLHYNRGKKAWTYMADLYAFMLLYLAISGIFMIKGRLGLRWRGAILIGLGLGVPLTYVIVSGGPNAHQNAKTASTPAAAAPTAAEPVTSPAAYDEFARPPERMAPRTAPAPDSAGTGPPTDDEFARPPVRKQPSADDESELVAPGTLRK
ncbi:MAG: hypothetical protein H0T42_34575 [Deltaproteobacteria bacterium]|nr:hypothetical protein [Deltaproteobacteria bacterium]